MTNKFFFVAVDDSTKEQRDAFTISMRGATAIGFWHQTETAWLVVDASGALTSEALRRQVTAFMPEAAVIVVQATPIDWATVAPQAAHEWLHDFLSPMKWRP